MQLPAAQCELQLALPEQLARQSPEGQVVSQVALPVQVCVHTELMQSCVHWLVVPQVFWQVASAWQVWSHCADALQSSVHFAPVQAAVQSLMPVQLFVHCLSGPAGAQLKSQVCVSPQLPLPVITTGGPPAPPVMPALPPLPGPPPLPEPPPLLAPPLLAPPLLAPPLLAPPLPA